MQRPAIAFARALRHGEPIMEKTVTVSGDGVKEPVNVRVPVGVPVSEIIAACGGYTAQEVKLIAGGPMMGKTIVNDKWVIDRATNAVTVLLNKPFDSVACLRCRQMQRSLPGRTAASAHRTGSEGQRPGRDDEALRAGLHRVRIMYLCMSFPS